MSPAAIDLLVKLARRGIRLERRGERIRYCPASAMTPELAKELGSHKPELLAALTPGMEAAVFGTVSPGWSASDWHLRLYQLAERCEELQPERARFLRAWANVLESREAEERRV